MLMRRRKTDIEADVIRGVIRIEAENFAENDSHDVLTKNSISTSMNDCLKFAMYCMLLAVPLYAITVSIMKHDWLMAVIDLLIVPIGFLHGLLLLSGIVS